MIKLVNFYCGITVKGAHDPLKAFTSDTEPPFDSSLNADTIWQLLLPLHHFFFLLCPLFEEYGDWIKDMQICGHRWMWVSDVSYNLSDMLFQRRIWGGPHETFIWEEWLRRDTDENRWLNARTQFAERMLTDTWKCYTFQKRPRMECSPWYTCVQWDGGQNRISIQGEMSNYNNGPIIDYKALWGSENQ